MSAAVNLSPAGGLGVGPPDELGPVSTTVTTAFGGVHVVGPSVRTSDEVVLFLHGYGSSWSVWAPVMAAVRALGLLPGCDLVAVDLPGFGSSENRLGHLESQVVGEELLQLVHRLGYRRVRLAGHSMGGFLALDMTARFSNDISSVHIVSGAYFTLVGMVNRPVATALRSPVVGLFYLVQLVLSRHDGWAQWINRKLAARAKQRHITKPLYTLGGPGFRYGARNGLEYDAQAVWGGITVPVYGVFGGRDVIVPRRDMRTLQAILPDVHLRLIADSGHSSLIDHPTEVARALFEL